jgi:hypothetical protein
MATFVEIIMYRFVWTARTLSKRKSRSNASQMTSALSLQDVHEARIAQTRYVETSKVICVRMSMCHFVRPLSRLLHHFKEY